MDSDECGFQELLSGSADSLETTLRSQQVPTGGDGLWGRYTNVGSFRRFVLNCVPSNSYAEILTLGVSECDSLELESLKRKMKIK